jgi:hypothetical protein
VSDRELQSFELELQNLLAGKTLRVVEQRLVEGGRHW